MTCILIYYVWEVRRSLTEDHCPDADRVKGCVLVSDSLVYTTVDIVSRYSLVQIVERDILLDQLC